MFALPRTRGARDLPTGTLGGHNLPTRTHGDGSPTSIAPGYWTGRLDESPS